MNFSVTQNGQELSKKKYTWDESTKTFSTNENFLTLDFSQIDGVTFNTGWNCTFNTGWNCTFNTGYYCTFNTGSNCTFNTGYYCTFNTGDNCTFKTGSYCTFNTGWNCTFKTGSYCTFNTGDNCTFKTGSYCTFEVGEKCCLHYHWYGCFEVYKLESNKLVKILENGQLENLKDIEILKVEDLDRLVLLHSKDLKFLYSNENKKYQELLEAFQSKNDTKLFMLNDNSAFANNLIKIFKFKG